MKKRHQPSAPEGEHTELAVTVSDLQQEVRVLRDAIDDFRMELEYLNRNGIRLQLPDSGAPAGTLRMKGAVNRTEEDNDTNDVDSAPASNATDVPAENASSAPSPGQLF